MNEETPIEAMLKRDRIIVVLGLAGVTAIAWIYTLNLVWGMDMGIQVARPHMHARDALNFVLIFAMWVAMMTAMMVPSASPFILMFAAINRKRHNHRHPFVSTGAFLLGYLVAWTVFSSLTTLVQWGLQAATLLSHMMVINSPLLGGALLFAAGVFQWTPLKYACLTRCRSPLGFFINEWREGTMGALIMGLKHGVYCIGCCWLLMCVLFLTGVMNLV